VEHGERLQPGDLEGALLAGLGPTRRNRTLRELVRQGRPPPTGFKVLSDGCHATCEPTMELEGGHAWHGRRIVQLLMASGGAHALQVQRLCLCPRSIAFP
jgi:hypothetical protein